MPPFYRIKPPMANKRIDWKEIIIMDSMVKEALDAGVDNGLCVESSKILVPFSGGKDSTAVYLLCMELFDNNFTPVMGDTGNEHELTMEFARTLHEKTGGPKVNIVTNRYSEGDFAKKRERMRKKWSKPHVIGRGVHKGEIIPAVPDDMIEEVLSLVKPSGNVFLDACLMNGMFPTRMMQFCTNVLKIEPVHKQVIAPLLEEHDGDIWQLVGTRAQESAKRAAQPRYEEDRRDSSGFLHVFKPIFHWSHDDVFNMHRRHKLDPNPLYKLGSTRVGCMPCFQAGKEDIKNISKRFPEHIDKVREWEAVMSKMSRYATFVGKTSGFFGERGKHKALAVDDVIAWSNTTRGGDTADLFADEVEACSSRYGLCE